MQRRNLLSVAFAVAFSFVAPAANAWPLGRVLHLHPSESSAKDARITFQIFNHSGIIQEIEVGDHKFTLMPNSGLTITAPEGTQVISETVGLGHKKGDVLFAVQPTLRNDTVVVR